MRRRFAFAFVLAVVLILGAAMGAGAQPLPSIWVQRDFDPVSGEDWPPLTVLTITVNDPATPMNPDVETYVLTDAGGTFDISLGPPVEFQPSWTIAVTDGVTTKTHTVRDISITDADVLTGIVVGTAPPLTEVYVANTRGGGPTFDVMADTGGVWMTPPFMDEFSVLPGAEFRVQQFDEDGDHTHVEWTVPAPRFTVTLGQESDAELIRGEPDIYLIDWPLGATVDVTIDDPATALTPDYQDSVVVPEITNGEPGFHLPLAFAVKPGDICTVSDGSVSKSHTVLPITVDAVDAYGDLVYGTAVPGSQVNVMAESVEWLYTVANDAGAWVGDFSVLGDPARPTQADILPGNSGGAAVSDEDGDSTLSYFYLIPKSDWVHNPANSHDYLLVTNAMSWSNAQAYAVSLGGHLVSISDAAEYDWILNTFGTEYWIGLNDMATEGVWTWSSGDPVTFTDWLPGEPNDLMGEDAAYLTAVTGQVGWNDMPESTEAGFVVEVGVPTTLEGLLDDMVDDGRIPDTGIATSIMKQAQKAPLKAVTNHLASLVNDGVITQQTMDQILAMVAS